MKKVLVILLLASLFQSCAFLREFQRAVESSEEPISFVTEDIALVAGAGKSGIGGSKSGKSWEDPLGGLVGLETTVYKMNENSSVRSGFNFSFQGSDYTEEYVDEYDYGYSDYDASFSGTVSTTYLNFPVLYNYKTSGGFYAEAGLQPGFLLSAKDKIEGGESYTYKNNMKGFELGLPVGLGYHLSDQLSIGARAIWGLTNNSDSGSGDKDHNYLITGTISYKIGSLFYKNE